MKHDKTWRYIFISIITWCMLFRNQLLHFVVKRVVFWPSSQHRPLLSDKNYKCNEKIIKCLFWFLVSNCCFTYSSHKDAQLDVFDRVTSHLLITGSGIQHYRHFISNLNVLYYEITLLIDPHQENIMITFLEFLSYKIWLGKRSRSFRKENKYS